MFSTHWSQVTIALLLLRSASPVLALHARHPIDNADLIARELDINAAAIFPAHQAHRRGLVPDLLNGLGTVLGTVVNDVGGVVNTLLGAGTTTTTAAAAAATTTQANNNNNNGGNAATTTAAANNNNNGSGSGGNANSNSNANDSSGATSANNNGGNNNAGVNGNTVSANAGSGASNSGTGNGGTAPVNAVVTGTPVVVGVLTDHSGHTITTTGTAPITLTYVTTLPNGVVSTVTEVITPSAEVIGGGSGGPNPSAPKTAAIAGSIVALFIIIFIVVFLLLMLRKRRRAIQLANSRPESTISFGSEDILNHNYRRDSNAPLEPSASVTSFRTAPTYIDGQKMEFPLPPIPSSNSTQSEMADISQRRVSTVSDLTFDLAERRSRTSLIADRNLYRKIGQYPDAGTYTPFAFAPSSELGHSEEGLNNSELGASNIKEFHQSYRRSRNLDFAPSFTENPFSDLVEITPPTPMASAVSVPPSAAGTSAQRLSGLWRKATFGSSQQPPKDRQQRESHPPSAFTNNHADMLRKSSVISAERGTILSQPDSEYETAMETQSKHSSAGYSYHSAFGRYANEPTDNPFDDANALEAGSPPPSSRLLTSASGWRPTTGRSNTTLSVISSGVVSNRDTVSTPDPKDFFYQPPSTGQSVGTEFASSRVQRPSTSQSVDEEGTIRQPMINYPSLGGVFSGSQTGR